MTLLNRRDVIAGMAGAALPIVGMNARAAEAVHVTHAVLSLAYLQSFVAQAKGYFKAADVDVDIVNTGGGGPDVQLVIGGKAEFTVSDGAQVLPAIQRGQSLKCVLTLFNRSLVNVTMRRQTAERLKITAATPVEEKLRALKGLKIGVTRVGALTWQLARYNLRTAGLNADSDAEVIGIGDAPSLAAALRQGNIDAMYISVPIGESLVAQGHAVTYIDNARGEDPALSTFLMEGLWATPSYINANREVVAKVVGAYRKASHFIAQATAEEVSQTVKSTFSGSDSAVLLEGIKRAKQAVSASGVVDEATLTNTQRVLEVGGMLKRKIALSEIYDGSFVSKA